MGFNNMGINERYSEFYNIVPSDKPSFPRVMLLETTNVCNHACLFCDHSKSTRKPCFIDKELALRIIDEAYTLGSREVGLYMLGEPLADRNLEEYIRHSKDVGYEYVYITTNGSLLDSDRMKSVLSSGLDSIKFSINASNPERYKMIHGRDDYERAIKAVKACAEYREKNELKLYIAVSCVITKYTTDDGEEIKKQLEGYVDEFVILECKNQCGNMNEEIEKYLCITNNRSVHEDKEFCFYPYNRVCVTSEGYLTICCTDYRNYLAVEDLSKMSLEEAWNSDRMINIRRRHIENELHGTVCYNCLNKTNEKVMPLNEELASFGSEETKNNQIKERIENWKSAVRLQEQ